MTRNYDNFCEVENCNNPCWKDVCRGCARKIRMGTIPPAGSIKPNPTCSVQGCTTPTYTSKKDMCRGHAEFERVKGRDPKEKREKRKNGSLAEKCLEGDCAQPVVSKDMCSAHYASSRYVPKWRKCPTEGCEKSTKNELCAKHLNQLKAFGITWEGVRPTEEIRRIRESKRPFCQINGCEKRSTSQESRLCRTHRSDRSRKGCSEDFYLKLMEEVKCQSCGVEERLVTDHDHSCHPGDAMCEKCIRGRICNGCNTSLGLLGEDVQRILALAEYAKKISRGR